jgi:hypothetical protein
MATNGTTVTMSTFDALLKNVYIDKKNLYVMDAFQNKALTAIPKATDATGRNWNVSVVDSSVVGTAGTYATARSNASAGNDIVFQGIWKDKFAALFLDEKTIRMSISKEGAVDQALTQKIDSVRRTFNQSTEYQLFRDEGGSVARILTGSTSGNTTVLTFTTNTQIPVSQYLKIGHVLNFTPNSNGSSLRATGGTPYSFTITAMSDANTFSVTATGSAGAWGQLQANDYVVIGGDGLDAGSATTATNVPLAGFASWVPTTAPATTDSFKGVNRSQDPRGLAGVRIDATNLKTEEAFYDGADVTARFGGETDLVLTHPTTLTKLKKELAGQARYERFAGRPGVKMSKAEAASFGFNGLALDANGRSVIVAGAWACQSNLSWLLTSKHWKLWTSGPWPDVRGRDGLTMLRQTDTSYIYELVGYGELVCYAPGFQGVLIHDNAA